MHNSNMNYLILAIVIGKDLKREILQNSAAMESFPLQIKIYYLFTEDGIFIVIEN